MEQRDLRRSFQVISLSLSLSEMARAEGMDGRLFKNWGSMAILLNQDALDSNQERAVLTE